MVPISYSLPSSLSQPPPPVVKILALLFLPCAEHCGVSLQGPLFRNCNILYPLNGCCVCHCLWAVFLWCFSWGITRLAGLHGRPQCTSRKGVCEETWVSISAWEGHRELQQILEKPEKVCRSHVPPFPGLKLAVSYGEVG